MRKHGWMLAAFGLASAGCHRGSDAKTKVAQEQVANQNAEAKSVAAEAAEEAPPPKPEPFVVDNDRIDRYLAYQEATLRIYQDIIARVQAMGAKVDAGAYNGALGTISGMRESMDVIQSQTEAEEKARQKVGLSERDIEQLQQIVGDVVAQRKMAAMFHYDQQIHQFEAMRAQVPEDQRKRLDESLASLKQQQDQAEKLTDARKQYGDANIDAVLAREKDLSAAYDHWLQVFATGGRK